MSADGLVLTAPRRFELHHVDVPEVGDDDGVLRVEACGLCGTDHEQYSGHIPSRHPFIPGHEVIGTIEQVGAVAAERWRCRRDSASPWRSSSRAVACAACRAGVYRRCERHGLATMVGFVDADRPPGLCGGYATHLYLGLDSMLLAVPTDPDPVLATMFNPLGAGIRWAVDLPGTDAGQVVAVLGPGVRGLCAAAAANRAGAGFVMVTGRGSRDADRLALAARFGADLAVDVATDDPARALKAVTGGLADVVIDVTAMAPAAFAHASGVARPGGTVVVSGTRGSSDAPGFQPDHIVYKELRLLGALSVDVTAYRPALEMLASGRYPFADLPREVVGFAGLVALVQRMAGEADGTPPVHAVFAPSGGRS